MYHNKCIVCHRDLVESLTIDNLFSKLPSVCPTCIKSLTEKEDCKRCAHCKKKLAAGEERCTDCLFLNHHFGFVNDVDFVCDYTDDVSSLLHRYKSNGDILLAKAFAESIKQHFNSNYFKAFDAVIPMPISDGRLKSRGFNHVTEILDQLNIHYIDALHTAYRDKQMNLNKKARIQQDNPFTLKQSIANYQRILLVDDIYTTGLTMSRAKRVILASKDCKIKMLAFARA